MKFSRLRLSGFKSFVESTELHIEPGLTGVVGPNGCGKSNLLEALRWVMGESSYKSMRASAMDDVIFSGTANRPARNMAEVTLTLDVSVGQAPASFKDETSLEISRRIERESGSAYRINGRETRARDVQLLFADAATGARSPALVKQGQIGELINAKPQARRRILEEAAGITGLHTRRHEAELKLNAAETNLTRLEDVTAQLETQLQGLKRQARQAVRYKQLSASIRKLEATSLLLAWREACTALDKERANHDELVRLVAGFTQAVSVKTRQSDAAQEALPALRQAETVRSAVLQRLNTERDELAREEKRAEGRQAELHDRLKQTHADLAREREIVGDTGNVSERLANETADLTTALDNDANLRRDAAVDLQAAADRLARAQEQADAATAKLSEMTARRDAAQRRLGDLERQRDRLARELEDVAGQREALAGSQEDDEAGQVLAGEIEQGQARVAELEAAQTESETLLSEARQREGAARKHHDENRRTLDRLTTEVRTLTKLLNVSDGDLWPPVIDALLVQAGYETALGAALGDDLDAPMDEAAPVRWHTLPDLKKPAFLPGGVQSLADFVDAPAALKRRLSQIGIVDAAKGGHLQSQLEPGQRLVSLEGDLWRWDGFTAAADAPTAAANRLAERNRLVQLQDDQADAEQAAETSQDELRAVQADLTAKQDNDRQIRQDWKTARQALEAARSKLAEHEKRTSGNRQKLSALAEAQRRIEAAVEEVRASLDTATQELAAMASPDTVSQEVSRLRAQVDEERGLYAQARAQHDGLEGEAQARARRLEAIAEEQAQWKKRAERADGQIAALTARAETTAKEIATLKDLPEKFEERRRKLLNALSEAEQGRQDAADALARGESAAATANTELREAETQLGHAREEQARVQALIEAGELRVSEVVERCSEALDCAPDDIARHAELDDELPEDRGAVDRQLQQFRDQRERLGGVNLMAEDEAEKVSEQLDTLNRERDDLIAAIGKLRSGINSLNKEGRVRLLEAFEKVNDSFGRLFTTLFAGGKAELRLIESDDPLEAGLEIFANPPGKRPQVLSLLSGGEQALTAMALIFAVFLTNPSPICVLDEVDAPLDDHNVERFCNLLDAMLEETDTRFLIITHHALTMARMHRLFGVTMRERGVSQLVSVDLQTAESYREAS